MKDGVRILDQVKKIKKKTNNMIRLYTSATNCNKKKESITTQALSINYI